MYDHLISTGTYIDLNSLLGNLGYAHNPKNIPLMNFAKGYLSCKIYV